jgi:hypothetical protein
MRHLFNPYRYRTFLSRIGDIAPANRNQRPPGCGPLLLLVPGPTLPELDGALDPRFMPVVPDFMPLPAWFFIAVPRSPVVLPSIDLPVVVLLAAGPSAFELPPAVFPADCASAAVLLRERMVRIAIALAFMECFLSVTP